MKTTKLAPAATPTRYDSALVKHGKTPKYLRMCEFCGGPIDDDHPAHVACARAMREENAAVLAEPTDSDEAMASASVLVVRTDRRWNGRHFARADE